jgi:uncharacterized integral membrane protein
MRALRRLWIVAVFVGLLVLGWRFAAANPSGVAVDLVFATLPEAPLWTVLLVAFAAGAVATGVALGLAMAVLGLENRRFRRAVGKLESEVHQLRTLPLSEAAVAPPADDLAEVPSGAPRRS